jgi:hypothetical protein
MTNRLLILLAHSTEMGEAVLRSTFVGRVSLDIKTRIEHAATTVNSLLGRLSGKLDGGVGVVSYCDTDGNCEYTSHLSESLENVFVQVDALSDLVKDTETRYKQVPSPTGGLAEEVEFEFPIWYQVGELGDVSGSDGLENLDSLLGSGNEPTLVIHIHATGTVESLGNGDGNLLDGFSNLSVINLCMATSDVVPSIVMPTDFASIHAIENRAVGNYSLAVGEHLAALLCSNGINCGGESLGLILNAKLIDLAKVCKAGESFLEPVAITDEGDSDEGDSDEGDSDEGDSDEGDSDEGDSDEGDSDEGDSDEGDSDEGDSDEGDSDEGDSDEGDSDEDDSDEDDSDEDDSDEDDSDEDDSDEDDSDKDDSDEDGIGILILFDPSGADNEALAFKKSKASLGMLLEKLARSDNSNVVVELRILGEGNDKALTTTIASLASTPDEQCEEYTEELAAGGGRIMSIPHRIPWVISPIAIADVDPTEALGGIGESLMASASSVQCYVIGSDSDASAITAKRLIEVKNECPDVNFRIWLHSEDAVQHCEMPASVDQLSLTECQNDFYALAAIDDGLPAFVINGRSPKLIH